MAETENLNLPLLEAGQAQKHVTLNEALRRLDTMVQLAVASVATSPPGAAAEGARHIVGPGASGAWSGNDDAVATFRDGAWAFAVPRDGWLAFVVDEPALLFWSGAAWVSIETAITALQTLSLLGVNATADATNRLAVRSPAILHTAVYAADGGSGDVQHKLNKESAGDTASLVFQTDYGGRAEIGLAGDDNLHLKTSPDGSAWATAAIVSKTSGHWGLGGAAPDSGIASALLTGLLATSGHALLDGTAIYNTDTPVPFYTRRARGTPSSPSGILAGDRFFGFYGGGYHTGGAYSSNAVAFQGVAEEDFTAGAWETRVEFATTAIGATSRRVTVQFRANGSLQLVPLSAAPASPSNGQLYYDGTTGKFRGYAAGAWVDLH